MRSHDPRLAVAVTILLALTLLPAAAPTDAESVDTAEATATPTPRPQRTEPADAPDPRKRPDRRPNLAVYRGMGTWIDMYNAGPYVHPNDTVRAIARQGVTTLYLQTGNYQRPHDPAKLIFRHRIVSRIIEAAHRHDIAGVAWYLPSFKDLEHDYRRSRAAITFRTPHGERFDGFALDIESPVVDNLDVRNRRLDVLSRRLNKLVPPSYALGAIVPEAGAIYWRDFPYRMVANHFDVFLPMAYYTFRASGYDGVVNNLRRNVRAIRTYTGDRDMPVHLIGGLAEDSRDGELRAFVDTALDRKLIGASVYDWPTTPRDDWRELRRLIR